jgi:hypothetical protein
MGDSGSRTSSTTQSPATGESRLAQNALSSSVRAMEAMAGRSPVEEINIDETPF